MGFSDYNSNPDLNVSISGVNIGEGCPPSGINNAIRQIMADAKTADGGYVKNTSSGAIVTSGLTVSSGATIKGGVTVSGGVTVDNGKTDSTAHALTYDANSNGNAGIWDTTKHGWLIANNAGGSTFLNDGPVHVTSNLVVSGGLTVSGGTITYGSAFIYPASDDRYPGWDLDPGSAYDTGSAWVKCWCDNGGSHEKKVIGVNKATGGTTFYGSLAGSSDERLKGGIATISDKTLDAWSKVDWRQYRYKADGAGAPVHFGIIAQHVSSCLAEGGVSPSGYALIENKALTEGGKDEWAVYYQEAFALEAAYQRRRADKAEERIAALERRLDALEAAFVAAGA